MAFRLLTARGPGGVAVVALEGADRHRIARQHLTRLGGSLLETEGLEVPTLALLRLADTVLDQVLVVERPGLQRLEIQLHGSEAVLEALEAGPGLRRARVTDPARILLDHALGPGQVALALEQGALGQGALGQEAKEQAATERPAVGSATEHLAPVRLETWVAGLVRLAPEVRRQEVMRALERSRVARALAEPCTLVLCGRQNAGKSTLMNRLLVRERVLAGNRPGLTRDPVRETTCLDGYPYELVDTAGERDAVETVGDAAAAGWTAVDRAALERGRSVRDGALLLVVVDGSRAVSDVDRELAAAPGLVVRSKADLVQARWDGLEPDWTCSGADAGAGPELRLELGRLLRRRRGLPEAGPVGGPAALDAAQVGVLQAVLDSG